MIISGVDSSKNSTAIVKLNVDDDSLEINSIDYLAFCDVKKWADKDDRIIFYKKADYKNNIKKHDFMITHMAAYLNDIDYIAYEAYAYGGSGNTFDVAETCGTLKYLSYNKGSNIRVYAPGQIKKYFAFSGSATKLDMGQAYYNWTEEPKLDLSHLAVVDKNKDVKPTSDIIDAYATAVLLLNELRVRHGLKTIKDLHPDKKLNLKRIEVFNAVSKQFDENILVREFTIKE